MKLGLDACIGTLCLVASCTTAADESQWSSSPGGGIVRVTPLELRVPSGSRTAHVELQVLPASETLFVARCGRSDLDITLQWRREGKWEPVPHQFCSYVLAPPLVVAPGTRASAPLPVPVHDSDGEQEYRVVAVIYTAWRAEHLPDSSVLLPLALRTSNSFRIGPR